MRWMAAMAIVLGFTFVMSACGGRNDADNLRNQLRTQGVTDERITDPQVINDDVDLKRGDQGIGRSTNGAGTFTAQSAMTQVFPNPSISPINGSLAENAIRTASQFMGTPYQFGSDRDDPASFDCSDFTRWAFLSGLGMDLPLDSRSQARYVQTYSNRVFYNLNNARRGDLLFFTSFRGGDPNQYEGVSKSVEAVSHCGIYLGDGKMIHTASPRTGGVRIDNVFGNHLQWRFYMGGSVLDQK
ncbi:C40 family peptidase [Paenibacillus methanolicus]|uniref:Cell wall-associated NlpC family hydrolase n=1 Tax=Paenibacillus methanolicus TaxID=582686 RepID=A0A5S5CHR9_9BACL|nr:C40 family peptidase [Paenibacillus methanolicus]TYP79272.1 cell wall-associated NlpC family hydrolase [Paenibacillus methanolicus]